MEIKIRFLFTSQIDQIFKINFNDAIPDSEDRVRQALPITEDGHVNWHNHLENNLSLCIYQPG